MDLLRTVEFRNTTAGQTTKIVLKESAIPIVAQWYEAFYQDDEYEIYMDGSLWPR